jgi:hypothetical protein
MSIDNGIVIFLNLSGSKQRLLSRTGRGLIGRIEKRILDRIGGLSRRLCGRDGLAIRRNWGRHWHWVFLGIGFRRCWLSSVVVIVVVIETVLDVIRRRHQVRMVVVVGL